MSSIVRCDLLARLGTRVGSDNGRVDQFQEKACVAVLLFRVAGFVVTGTLAHKRRRRVVAVGVTLIIALSTLSFYFFGPMFAPSLPMTAFRDRRFLVATNSGVFQSAKISSAKVEWQTMVDSAVGTAALSPDGRLLAYIRVAQTAPPETTVRIMNLETGQSKVVRVDATTKLVHSMDWAPDSSAMIFLTSIKNQTLYMTDALYLVTADGGLTKLTEAAREKYSSPACGVSEVFGELSARWIARGVLAVDQFSGPFPGTVACSVMMLFPDHTYFLHVNRAANQSRVNADSAWEVAAAIPPGDKAIIYRSVQDHFEWYIANSDYFQTLDVRTLTKLEACAYPLHDIAFCPFLDSGHAASPDGSQFAWLSGNSIRILNLTSLQITLLTEDNTKLLKFPQSENWRLQALVWSPDGTMLGLLLSHSDQDKLVLDVGVIIVASRNSANLGRVTNAGDGLLAFGLTT